MSSQAVEKRTTERIDAQWGAWMTLQASGSHYYAITKDISVQGAQFAGPLLVEAKEAVQLSIRKEAADLPIQCEGQVRWSRLGNDGQWHFGVEFTGLASPSKEQLFEFVQTH